MVELEAGRREVAGMLGEENLVRRVFFSALGLLAGILIVYFVMTCAFSIPFSESKFFLVPTTIFMTMIWAISWFRHSAQRTQTQEKFTKAKLTVVFVEYLLSIALFLIGFFLIKEDDSSWGLLVILLALVFCLHAMKIGRRALMPQPKDDRIDG